VKVFGCRPGLHDGQCHTHGSQGRRSENLQGTKPREMGRSAAGERVGIVPRASYGDFSAAGGMFGSSPSDALR
jgi:hypothetical protein